MAFLETIIHNGLDALSSDRHDPFLRALRHSLTVAPAAYTPESFQPFGFTQRELYNLKVLLLRPLALEFLQSLGMTLSQSQFDKRTSYAAYEQHYGRAPWLISVRPRIMLLTYTEWHDLAVAASAVAPIPLPPILQELRD